MFAGGDLADPQTHRVASAVVTGGVGLAFQVPGALAGDGEGNNLDA
jgi:hypothetical protein